LRAGHPVKARGVRKEAFEMLENYPKEIILRDGAGVTLRPLQQGDEDLLFRMYNRLPEEDRWFLDADVSNIETIRNWVMETEKKGLVSIVGALEGEIIAHAVLLWRSYGAKRHIGKIRLTVDPSFRERHLGTWILLDIHNLAISMGLEMLVMRLIAGRDSYVIKGVRRLDFSEEAVLKNYVKDREGNPHDLLIMVKRLKRGWDKIIDLAPPE